MEINSNASEAGSDNHMITPDVVDGFERKSFELLEYVNSLEAKLDQQMTEFKLRESQAEGERRSLKQKYDMAVQSAKADNSRLQQQHDLAVKEAQKTIDGLHDTIDTTESTLRKEKKKELETTVDELKQQLEQKEQLYRHRMAREEKEKSKLEKELQVLRKKVTMGWILGCLSEVYLRIDDGEGKEGHENAYETTKDSSNECSVSHSVKPEKVLEESLEREVRNLIDSRMQSLKPSVLEDSTASQENSHNKESDSSDEFSEEYSSNPLKSAEKPEPQTVLEKPRGDENVCPSGSQDKRQIEQHIEAGIEFTTVKPKTHPKSPTANPRSTNNSMNMNMNMNINMNTNILRSQNSSRPQTPTAIRPKSPMRPVNKLGTSALTPSPRKLSPPRSPKKSAGLNILCAMNEEECAGNYASSPRDKELSRAEMFRRQRDIHKLISNMESSLNSLIDAEKKKRT
eukprot:Gb_32059 [translate_table: standard]